MVLSHFLFSALSQSFVCSFVAAAVILNLRVAGKTSSRSVQNDKTKQKRDEAGLFVTYTDQQASKFTGLLAQAVQAQCCLEEDRLAIPRKRFLSTGMGSTPV